MEHMILQLANDYGLDVVFKRRRLYKAIELQVDEMLYDMNGYFLARFSIRSQDTLERANCS